MRVKISNLKYKLPFQNILAESEIPLNVHICGGAVRDAMIGVKFDDVDIFGLSKEALDSFAEKHLKEFKLIYNSEPLKTYQKDNLKVQLIYRIFGTMEEIIDQFDYTICQFACDGKEVECSPEAIIHLYEKKLIVHKLNPVFVASSMERMQKYIQKGFTICSGGIAQLIATIRQATEEEVKENFEFYPDGRSRTMRFD